MPVDLGTKPLERTRARGCRRVPACPNTPQTLNPHTCSLFDLSRWLGNTWEQELFGYTQELTWWPPFYNAAKAASAKHASYGACLVSAHRAASAALSKGTYCGMCLDLQAYLHIQLRYVLLRSGLRQYTRVSSHRVICFRVFPTRLSISGQPLTGVPPPSLLLFFILLFPI